MIVSKRLMALVLSGAMIFGSSMTALADNPSLDPTAGSTAGTANILDYSVETIIVPTAIKVALNPRGYDVTKKFVKATTFDADEVYYTESSGSYTVATVADQTALDAGTFYYADTDPAQIVSLNYGIANKSTAAKTVEIEYAVTYTADETKTAIEFVDSAEKVAAYDEESNADGAKRGEMKMYLAVASATAAPTVDEHYYLTKDKALDGEKTYYTVSSGEYTEVDSPDVANIATYYEKSTAVDRYVTSALLSDVAMTASEEGNIALVAGTTNKAEGTIGYGLSKATWQLKDGEYIDFTTVQTDMENKLEMSEIGGYAGFTFIGAMNTVGVDWTKADTTAITITPTYTVADANEDETAVTGAYGQILLESAPSIAETTFDFTKGTAKVVNVSLGSGALAATKIASVTASQTKTGTYASASFITVGTDSFTIGATGWGSTEVDSHRYIKVIFDDEAKTTIILDVTIKSAG